MMTNQVKKGGEIILLDNKFVEGSSTPISRIDDAGNTFQIRQLKSGETFEVLKNFPDRNDMKAFAEAMGVDFQWIDFEYYWIAKFKK